MKSNTQSATTITRLTDLPLYLTPDEAAALLRTSRKAIYSMIERGQLPGVVRVRRRLLVHRDRLLDSLDQTCTPSSEGRR